jgi:hypothetical protein
LQLAEELTAGLTNPFDMALAVRDDLRSRIVYNDQIAAPPQDVDPVHYTLFVSREGYCNYYASAMAVMLRSRGVPARVVSGYTLGEFDEASRVYRVRANNAHTWVEVFFPGFGWIEFEPTATIPLVERPESAGGGDAFATASGPINAPDRASLLPQDDLLESAADAGLGVDGANGGATGFLGNISPWTVGITAAILVVAGGLMLVAQRLNARVEGDVDRSYDRLGGWARWLGVVWRPTQTPFERADLLVSAVPEGQGPVRNLTRQYVRKRFSAERSVEEGFDPTGEWRVLRPLLLRHSVSKFLDRVNRRPGRVESGEWRVKSGYIGDSVDGSDGSVGKPTKVEATNRSTNLYEERRNGRA